MTSPPAKYKTRIRSSAGRGVSPEQFRVREVPKVPPFFLVRKGGGGKDADGTSGQDTNSGSGVKTGHIQNDAVTSPKIANGAVTDAKIFGPIDPSKVPHNHDGVYEKKYANVVVVSKDGNGDFTNPVAAMASITNASASNPYLVKIMPGVCDIGTTSLQMKEYVDIERSRQGVTTATG